LLNLCRYVAGDANKLPAFVTVHDFRAEVQEKMLERQNARGGLPAA
jgi:hypothetical protein